MNLEEFPQEILVRIYEYSSRFPKDHRNWCLVSCLFYGVAKRNSHDNLTRFCFHLNKRNKKLKRQNDEQLQKFLDDKRDLSNKLQKKTAENTNLRKFAEAKDKEVDDMKRASEFSGGYQRINFRYY